MKLSGKGGCRSEPDGFFDNNAAYIVTVFQVSGLSKEHARVEIWAANDS